MSLGISNTSASSRQQRLKILGQDEIDELYRVPRFSDEEREQHFTLSVTEQVAQNRCFCEFRQTTLQDGA